MVRSLELWAEETSAGAYWPKALRERVCNTPYPCTTRLNKHSTLHSIVVVGALQGQIVSNSQNSDVMTYKCVTLHLEVNQQAGSREVTPLYSLSLTGKVVLPSWPCCLANMYKSQEQPDRITNPLADSTVHMCVFYNVFSCLNRVWLSQLATVYCLVLL